MTPKLVLVAASVAVLALRISSLTAQAPAPSVTFEAATVKANTSGAPNGNLRPSAGGRVDAVNMPLDRLIAFAYNLLDARLVGVPTWTSSARYDIVAKLPIALAERNDPTQAIRDAMVALLIERFKLAAHKETRQLDIYALVLTRAGGQPNAAVKRTNVDCAAAAIAQRTSGAFPPGPGEPGFCGVLIGPDGLHVGGMPVSMITGVLATQVGRVVEDRTGLVGGWDFDLKFTPTVPGANFSPDPNAPSVFTAIQEQLGFKLESIKAPVEVTVIDHVERPTEN